MYRRQELLEKLKEAAASVLPISLIVLAICFVLVPVDTGPVYYTHLDVYKRQTYFGWAEDGFRMLSDE